MAMSDLDRVATELYVPATNKQLRGFADTLQSVANRLLAYSGTVEEAEFEVKIGSNEENQKVQLLYECDPDTLHRRFYLNTITTRAIDEEWSREAANLPLGKRDLLQDNDDEGDTEADYDSGDDVNEGYIQHDVQLTIVRGMRAIDANKTITFNVLDESGDGIDAHYACMRGTEDAVKVATEEELELLFETGQTALDARFNEQMLSMVTPADLIVGAFALTSVGMLDKRKLAYPKAPTYIDIMHLLPRMYSY